jgi:hypothetical protein
MAKKKKSSKTNGLFARLARFFTDNSSAPTTYEVYQTIGNSHKIRLGVQYEINEFDRRNGIFKELNELIRIRLLLKLNYKVESPLDVRIRKLLKKL